MTHTTERTTRILRREGPQLDRGTPFRPQTDVAHPHHERAAPREAQTPRQKAPPGPETPPGRVARSTSRFRGGAPEPHQRPLQHLGHQLQASREQSHNMPLEEQQRQFGLPRSFGTQRRLQQQHHHHVTQAAQDHDRS